MLLKFIIGLGYVFPICNVMYFDIRIAGKFTTIYNVTIGLNTKDIMILL